MNESRDVPTKIFSFTPSHKVVHFDGTTSTSAQSLTTSTYLLTNPPTASTTLPFVSEKPSLRFKFLFLLLSLFIALFIGFIISLLLLTHIMRMPNSTLFSYQYLSKLNEQSTIYKRKYLVEHFAPSLIDELDFNVDVCQDFYGFVCRKWLLNHPLSSLNLKRSWLTEQSQYIRANFAKLLTNLSQIEVQKAQQNIDNNQTHMSSENVNDYGEALLDTNELQTLFSFYDHIDDEPPHKLVKRQLNTKRNNFSQSLSNMLLYYDQCTHTTELILIQELKQLAHNRFWFSNNYETTSMPHHLDLLFEQMLEHPLMHIWNTNTINLGTQIIIHIQSKIQHQQSHISMHQLEQATMFEHYVQTNHINLCYQSTRAGSLDNTFKEYNQLLTSTPIYSNSSINDDLDNLISNKRLLPIIYSSITRASDLRDLAQFMLDKGIIQSLNNTKIDDLFSNFTNDLEQHLSSIPIFRSTILNQCQLLSNYYIRFRSINDTQLETWLDYITSSIIHLIIHSWPGDASYTCLYSTIVRHNQFETIPYWNTFIQYTKKQIKQISLPLITVEIRLVDFFQLDSVFRFLFADQFAHYCNLMVYEYGPKLLPFLSVFHERIRTNLKGLWRQILHENSKQQINIHSLLLSSNHIPHDCLALLEHYFPYTLSSFYEMYLSNKTEQLYMIANELRYLLQNTSDRDVSSLVEFHIKSERLKLYHELSPTKSQIPYEYYFIEDNYLSTTWNIIENVQEELVHPTHTIFEINGHHSIEQGIFLQPTIAELYSNETTRLAALLIIAHELGHAFCPCQINQTEREYFADLIALDLIISYHQKQLNRTLMTSDLEILFIKYVQSECVHINYDIISLINQQTKSTELYINRILQDNEQFQTVFNCSSDQQRLIKRFNNLLFELCATCRRKNN